MAVITKDTLAERRCEAESWDFGQVFKFQFRMSQSKTSLSSAWSSSQLNGWVIEHCPALPISRIISSSGEPIGLVLGIAISPEGQCLGKEVILDQDSESERERWVEDLAGRFFVVVKHFGGMRLYGDPSGNLSVVFNKENNALASSVALAVDDELDPAENVDIEKVATRKQFLLFGDTSDQRVTRLMPNHYLDLSNFSQHRFWPRDDTPFAELETDQDILFAQMSARMSRNVAALISAYECALPITAGRDSRIILGSAIPVLNKIKSFYCYHLNWATKIDAEVGQILAEHLSVPFLVLSRRASRVQKVMTKKEIMVELERTRLRTGWCSALRADWVRFVAASPRVQVVLRGTGIEMTRANKWRHVIGKPTNAMTGVGALLGQWQRADRTKDETVEYERQLDRYQNWMDKLPEKALPRLYDIAHLELWLPVGAAPLAYIGDFIVNPFNDRRLFHLVSAVSPRVRLTNALVKNLVGAHDTSLSAIPYHKEYVKNRNRPKAG